MAFICPPRLELLKQRRVLNGIKSVLEELQRDMTAKIQLEDPLSQQCPLNVAHPQRQQCSPCCQSPTKQMSCPLVKKSKTDNCAPPQIPSLEKKRECDDCGSPEQAPERKSKCEDYPPPQQICLEKTNRENCGPLQEAKAETKGKCDDYVNRSPAITNTKMEPPEVMVCYKIAKKVQKKKKKDEVIRLKQSKSRELRASKLYVGCYCEKRNGLQDDCPRAECHGKPECLTKPNPICGPSEFCAAKHLYKKLKKNQRARAGIRDEDSDMEDEFEFQCFPGTIESKKNKEEYCDPTNCPAYN